MKLIYSDASPYARTARIVLLEANLGDRVQLIKSHPFDNEAELIVANPLGKVPCLVTDEQQAIFDSEIICQYLDASFFQGKLWQSVASDWSLRTIFSLVSGLLDTCVALQQENMRRADDTFSEFWWQRFVTALDRGLLDLSKSLVRFPDEFSLLHINTLVLLGYLDFRHPKVNWRENNALNQFYSDYETRPSYRETVPL